MRSRRITSVCYDVTTDETVIMIKAKIYETQENNKCML